MPACSWTSPAGSPPCATSCRGCCCTSFWSERYGEPLLEERQREVRIRRVSDKLTRIQAIYEGDARLRVPPEYADDPQRFDLLRA